MRKYKSFLAIIAYFFIVNLNAENIFFEDSVVGVIGKKIIITNHELKKHETLLKLFIPIKKKRSMHLYSLNDILINKIQLFKSKKNKIESNDSQIEEAYKDAIRNKGYKEDKFEKMILKLGLEMEDVASFAKKNHLVEKTHIKLLNEKVTASRDDFYNFVKHSNAYDAQECIFRYKIMKISFIKKENNKTNIKNIKIAHDYIKKSDIKNGINIYFRDISLLIKIEFLNFNYPNKEKFKFTKKYAANLENDILGPFYLNNKIVLNKIIKKKYSVEKKDLNVRVGFIFFKKNSLKVKNERFKPTKVLVQRLDKIKQKLKNKNNKNNKDLRYAWLDELKLPLSKINELKELNENDVDIVESRAGWFVIKILFKDFDKNFQPSATLNLIVKREKFVKLRKNFINNMLRRTRIKRFNEKEIKKKFKSSFFNRQKNKRKNYKNY